MNRNSLLKSLILGLAVLLATSAFASNKASFHVQEAVQINGQALPAGDYQLRWDGSGSNVELSVLQGKKVIAKTAAKLVELNQPSAYDAAVIDSTSGTGTISQFRFAGKKFALAIGDEKTAANETAGMK